MSVPFGQDHPDTDAVADQDGPLPSMGAVLVDELRVALTQYVVLPSAEAADAVTLWIAATHGQPAWEHAPRLVITAPEKRCGKSRLLDIIEALCHDPLITVNASVAAVVRSIGADPPTLLVDETDTIFGPKAKNENEDLRGILNAGHQRNRPSIRFNVTKNKVEKLNTFAMAALAGIGDLPDTIMDRAVIVRMRRRAPGESVRPYRTRRDRPGLVTLAGRVNTWARDHLDKLIGAEPDMPVEDRAADTWEPLVAIADLTGGDWPQRARNAATMFTNQADELDAEGSLSLRLLTDLQTVFGDEDRLATQTALERLHKIDDAPWNDLYGKPLDARGLAKRLRPYEVKTKQIRLGDKTLKGLDRTDLHEVWRRYLPGERNKRNKANIPGQSVSDGSTVSDKSETDGSHVLGLDLSPNSSVSDRSETESGSETGLTCEVTRVPVVSDTRRVDDQQPGCCQSGPVQLRCQLCPDSPSYWKETS